MHLWKKLAFPILALCLWETAVAADLDSAEPSARVLFLCEHGNVKSLMAMSYFNQVAAERHLPFVAFSRGVAPDSTTVPPPIMEGLRKEGINVSAFHPVKVTAQDVASARRTIAISVPSLAAVASDGVLIEPWDDVPPATINFQASSAAIKAHIDTLVAQLVASQNDGHARRTADK